MAVQRHRRSYVVYPPDYDPGETTVVFEFMKFARARAKVAIWGDGSQIVEWVETFDKQKNDWHPWTNREWRVRGGRLVKALHKTKSGKLCFSEIK